MGKDTSPKIPSTAAFDELLTKKPQEVDDNPRPAMRKVEDVEVKKEQPADPYADDFDPDTPDEQIGSMGGGQPDAGPSEAQRMLADTDRLADWATKGVTALHEMMGGAYRALAIKKLNDRQREAHRMSIEKYRAIGRGEQVTPDQFSPLERQMAKYEADIGTYEDTVQLSDKQQAMYRQAIKEAADYYLPDDFKMNPGAVLAGVILLNSGVPIALLAKKAMFDKAPPMPEGEAPPTPQLRMVHNANAPAQAPAREEEPAQPVSDSLKKQPGQKPAPRKETKVVPISDKAKAAQEKRAQTTTTEPSKPASADKEPTADDTTDTPDDTDKK